MDNNYPINADPRPKRRKDKDNPYTIYSIGKNTDHPRYFVEFDDGEEIHQCVELTEKQFRDFDNNEPDDVSYMNECDRHLVKTNLSDTAIHQRSAEPTDPLQEIIEAAEENKRLHKAILTLSPVQQRRVLMYYFQDMTYEEIADVEHRSPQAVLKRVILDEIHTHAEAVEMDETAVIAKLKKQFQTEAVNDTKQEIAALRRRVEELSQKAVKLYEDKVSGQISEETFILLIQKNEQERQTKAERLDALLSEKNTAEKQIEDIQLWVDTVRAYMQAQEIDRDMLAALVEHIEVGEKIPVDGRMQQDITVVYRFVGKIE